MSWPHKTVIGHDGAWPGGFLQALRVFPRSEFLLLTPDLYPHQPEAVAWLRERKVGILADEQGLGKTISALVAARGFTRMLIIVPTVVLWNWKAEAEIWLDAPQVQVVENGAVDLDWMADIVVVTHGLLLSTWIASQLASAQWSHLIVDEAHKFKDVEAQRTAVLYLQIVPRADCVWFLTGTIMPNDASEIWTPMRGLAPRRLMFEGRKVLSYDDFVERFCVEVQGAYGPKIIGNRPDRIPELRKRLDGFILRRLKKNVLPDLPSIRYETVHLRPLKMDKALEALEAELAPRILEALRNPDADMGTLYALIKDDELARFRRLCGLAKAKPVAELLYQELDGGGLDKVVVFAHHKAVVEIIAHELHCFGARTITGATSGKERTEIVNEFQTDPSVRVIVANIVAGGVGVTLTAASEVVMAEQSWTPGDNAQAIDRLHRIGQKRRVRARFMALAGTVDEPITASNRRKSQMVREVLGE